jgi:hypothetical protein
VLVQRSEVYIARKHSVGLRKPLVVNFNRSNTTPIPDDSVCISSTGFGTHELLPPEEFRPLRLHRMTSAYSMKMADRHGTAFPEISDGASVMSSNPGGKVFRDISVSAYIGDASKKKYFKGKLDTGTEVCVISEHIVENKWGIERVDTTKKCTLKDLGINGVLTLGQIRLTLCLKSKIKEINVPFQVVPNKFVQYRFDALLSSRLIRRRSILVRGPDWQDEETDSEGDE